MLDKTEKFIFSKCGVPRVQAHATAVRMFSVNHFIMPLYLCVVCLAMCRFHSSDYLDIEFILRRQARWVADAHAA